ncbi:hypothetical protein BO70DRAFT_364752 [Aspergillus heteromorphus CBS 117.55]|uniref:Uncharacterized protein n=1 Tax=Aspergillus heteromorphus CBS 117.55 TaxID=1448321 RepID=A0A317VF32_9EURO|nr:uncharacterized protein BO70DRAFT_364752 [Aspergillus heteromorphus CBS 117.55]PWY72983.1 hypothetical protein BO70DRAFT_364752 [Aspergillus heteromorphus CBS 117.55]
MLSRLVRFVPLAGLLLLALFTVHYLYRATGEESQQDWEIEASPNALSDLAISDAIAHTHHEVDSASTPDHGYFRIDFHSRIAINPSIIPHPTKPDTWIITAQLHYNRTSPREDSVWYAELVCDAVFQDHDHNHGRTLRCIDPPFILPIAATDGESAHCTDALAYFALSIGPHDARVFYGPEAPYAIYGSNSAVTCFGQWVLDFRVLVDWPATDVVMDRGFRRATELQRPFLTSYFPVEKNWFIFWDIDGAPYAHYDIAPTRAFAQLSPDGTVGPDLAPAAASTDTECLRRYLPALTHPDHESIHQATNSLALTLCDRADPLCHPNDTNTLILTIFQYKSFVSFHSVYEPYVMLFRQRAPFEVYGISSKPLWIHGRGMSESDADQGRQTEMLYVTSISWKTAGQKYHGFLDDVLFLAFGREDSDTAGMDLLAGDLLGGLGVCDDM